MASMQMKKRFTANGIEFEVTVDLFFRTERRPGGISFHRITVADQSKPSLYKKVAEEPTSKDLRATIIVMECDAIIWAERPGGKNAPEVELLLSMGFKTQDNV